MSFTAKIWDCADMPTSEELAAWHALLAAGAHDPSTGTVASHERCLVARRMFNYEAPAMARRLLVDHARQAARLAELENALREVLCEWDDERLAEGFEPRSDEYRAVLERRFKP